MAAEHREEFEHWHSHEHFPERVGIPGFLRGARWSGVHGAEGFSIMMSSTPVKCCLQKLVGGARTARPPGQPAIESAGARPGSTAGLYPLSFTAVAGDFKP